VGFTTVPTAVCGDGVLDPGEGCDDGNTDPGDCCSATCTLEPEGSPCDDDLNDCTSDACDALGVCGHLAQPDGLVCDDGDGCTTADQCTAGVCVGAGLPDTDGDLLCDALDPDDDGDGVPDGLDADPLDRFLCRDADADGCDDCSSGMDDPGSDGPDFDGDGLCESEVLIGASQDTTLYESSTGDISNGSGQHFFAGRTAAGDIRRGLIAFDVAGSIPPGSVVHDVVLTLEMSRTGSASHSVGLHRVLADWGEAGSDAPSQEGGGTAAQVGDATWLYGYYATTPWASAGGDFDPLASDNRPVDNEAAYTWSSPGMVADVQAWLDAPATNYGWMLIGNEASPATSKRFDSREHPAMPPELWIHFSPSTPTFGACCAGDGSCSFADSGASCGAGGGAYQGDGTICAPNPCPQPVGACCASDGTCTEDTAVACAAGGRVYEGDLTTCAPDLCPLTELAPYVDPLPIPPVAQPVAGVAGGEADYEIAMTEFPQQLHRDLPATTVWGYDGSFPGPTIEATAHERVRVKWINDLRDDLGLPRTEHYLPVDLCPHGPNMHGASPRTVVHLHGAHTKEEWDGYPEDTILPGEFRDYEYPNHQLPATLWYHDHALGITRLNIYLGLAGFYLIRDAFEQGLGLPDGAYEIPLVVQDRSFDADGSFRYPAQWQETFFGDHNLVNGKVAPYLDVAQGKYRFRILNGANSRSYTFALSGGLSFELIGTDGGLLPAPVTLNEITLTPAERADVVVDFSGLPAGTEIFLTNSAPAPLTAPPGTGVVPEVMKFVVQGVAGFTGALPATLRPMQGHQEADAVEFRDFELTKEPDACTGFTWLINGLHWDDITEYPELGTTEVWRFINRSEMTHPMHVHLVMFQVLDRQPFTVVDDVVVPQGVPTPPAPHESGWKDTVPVYPGEIVRVIAKFEDYTGKFAHHCHIAEHEDQEMMRQFEVLDFCGNGVLGPTEECDDGNTAPGDCCSATCTWEPAGSACTPDANTCTRDVCDGAGVCTYPIESDGTSCDDGVACSVADECSVGVCTGMPSPDTDGDTQCDAVDADDDDDGVPDGADSAPLDPFLCRDLDGDSCDDCSSGTDAPTDDGTDTDLDGLCDLGDPDDDGDGVPDADDQAPLDPSTCRDVDADTCDDCSSGTDDPANDGLDTDGNGRCDRADLDDDSDGLENGWEQGFGTSVGSADSDGDGVEDAVELAAGSDPALASSVPNSGVTYQAGVLTGVSNSGWTTVALDDSYTSMVVVASARYDAASPPLVVRIQNASGSSFDARVDRADGAAGGVSGVEVHYLAVEEGVYSEAAHGLRMEAVRFTSSVTDRRRSWVGEPRSYQQTYAEPVVLGQVLTTNDPRFSVFWAGGQDPTASPDGSFLRVGKHVGEDPDTERLDEILGYVVLESRAGRFGAQLFAAGIGADVVTALAKPPPALQLLPDFGGLRAALVAQSGMQDADGSWAVLARPLDPTWPVLAVAVDEELIGDGERQHRTERVAELALADTPHASFWWEDGDAAALPPAATAEGPGGLSAVLGSFAQATDVDLYEVQIQDPARFSARTRGPEDTTLYLFHTGGEGVAANADDGTPPQAVFAPGDPITSGLEPGNYLLGIARHGMQPLSGGSAIFPAALSGGGQGPIQSGPVDAWGGAATGEAASYAIALEGAEFTAVPEPRSTWMLIAGCTALAGLQRRRRAPSAARRSRAEAGS
jgi:spore coat protein A